MCSNNRIYFIGTHNEQLIPLHKKLPFIHLLPDEKFTTLLARNHILAILNNRQEILIINTEKHQQHRYQLAQLYPGFTGDLRFIDNGNNLWISDFNRGLLALNLTDSSVLHFSKSQKGNRHIPHNLIHCFTEDRQGRVWIGTESGLAIYDTRTKTMSIQQFRLTNPNGLNTDPIYSAFCDRQGNVWLGTYFGGINFWNGQQGFFRTWNTGLDNWQLRGNVVSCLTEDADSNLWIGLEDNGLEKVNRQTGHVTHYQSGFRPNQLSYDNIHALLFVGKQELWIGSYTGGINILNTKTNRIRKISRTNSNGVVSNIIYDFLPTNDSIYIATSEGIIIYSISQRTFRRLKPKILQPIQFETLTKTANALWFSSSSGVYRYYPQKDSLALFNRLPKFTAINFVKCDSKGLIWIGDCYQGLCCYHPQNGRIDYFNPTTNFPASWIFSIEEGHHGWYWASSDKGLIKFNPKSKISIVYDSNSGMPFNQFNYRASFTDREGTIYFGGNHGMVSFNDHKHPSISPELPIAFTGVKLFNRQILPARDHCLQKSINQIRQLRLQHNQNVLTIEYTAFSYSSRGRCQYAYYLEGFDHQWNNVGNRNFATYTNLNPGHYIFHVRSVSNTVGAVQERTLRITILPPFWLTTWAYLIYLLIIAGILRIIFKVGKNLEKSRSLVILERREKEHADAIHRMKLQFFTNISHELKTPLTLILAPISRIMKEEKVSPSLFRQLSGIERNANRLYLLIHQLLEFRKVESGKEKRKITPCHLNAIIKGIGQSFDNTMENAAIHFHIHYLRSDDLIWLDIGKTDKIIFNLLSNAFKFTPYGGEINLHCSLSFRNEKTNEEPVTWLTIQVQDSGQGIHPDLLNQIFDRFFQVEDVNNRQEGSGIGLAFVKSLVTLLKGNIKANSIPGKGSVFTVELPASKNVFSPEEISSTASPYVRDENQPSRFPAPAVPQSHDLVTEKGLSSQPVILIAEDNRELLNFMKEFLQLKYNVIPTLNGEEALNSLKDQHPGLIISDIMMPGINGLELTRILKSNLQTSHIPVILLTSKTGQENELEGLKNGADYYIEKPFYPSLLEQTIDNIFKTRQNLIEQFKREEIVPISDIAHSESDKTFVEKLTSIILANISNPSLDISFLLREMNISRSLLHLKIKSLLGCSSTEFIRMIRLKEAVKLISSGKCNISQAAYECGFSSLPYFSRRFKESYGLSPREYFNRKQNF